MKITLCVKTALLVTFAFGLANSVRCGEAGEDGVAQRIRKQLRSWDRYDPKWGGDADVVVLASYRQGSYPCIFHEDGSSSMPMSSTFTVEEIIKGKIGRDDFDANLALLDEARFPRDFVSGRKYLVFLKPTEESVRLLNDRKALFGLFRQIGSKELVAIIDVSKSETEVESDKVTAHKTGKLGAFEFTPGKWEGLRKSEKIDLAAQRAFIPFIMGVVLPDRATIAHVRSYLGEPDHRHMNEDGTYYEYQFNAVAPTPNGTVSGRVELHFAPDTRLKGYYIKFYKHIEERSEGKGRAGKYMRELNAEELKELGLPAIDRYDP